MSLLFQVAAQLSRQLTQDWHLDLDRRISAADEATHGYMVTPEGKALGLTPLDLFTGPTSRTRYATRELQDHWLEHPRTTRAQFEQEWITQAARDPEDLILATAWGALE